MNITHHHVNKKKKEIKHMQYVQTKGQLDEEKIIFIFEK